MTRKEKRELGGICCLQMPMMHWKIFPMIKDREKGLCKMIGIWGLSIAGIKTFWMIIDLFQLVKVY